MNHLTIQNGNAQQGGAIAIGYRTKLWIYGSRFENNTAWNGGAIYGPSTPVDFLSSYIRVYCSEFLNNTASTGHGGAIYANYNASYVIEDTSFRDNQATSNSGQGGALYWRGGDGTVTNSRFISNSAAGTTNPLAQHMSGNITISTDLINNWWEDPEVTTLEGQADFDPGECVPTPPPPVPYATPTPTALPTVTTTIPTCLGSLIEQTTPPGTGIRLRVRPGIDQSIIDSLVPGTPVNLIDGTNHTDGYWWWHITLVDSPETEGYVRETLVNDFNSCPRVNVEPPPLPQPQAGEICYVYLKEGFTAEIRDGSGTQGELIGTITDPTQTIRVYGTSYGDRGLFLISQPGALPQQWVERSKFNTNPPDSRACKNTVLGRFNRTTDLIYWTAVGAYANGFRAPISPAQYSNEYPAFRISHHYIPGEHTGIDMVYRPPNGAGNSVPFDVYAQSNGVVVDAGPDGITRTYRLTKNYCGETPVDGNVYPNRNGVDYWLQPFTDTNICGTNPDGTPISGVREIYDIGQTFDKDNDPDNDDEERPRGGSYTFGLDLEEIRNLLTRGFVSICSGQFGCVDGAGRRLIIWYDVYNDDPDGINRPEIQTIYYHISMDSIPQYQTWRTVCSVNRDTTWERALITGDPVYSSCLITTAFAPDGFRVGQAQFIGFSTGTHLHYEVHIDKTNDGIFDPPPTSADREDPLMAFSTVR